MSAWRYVQDGTQWRNVLKKTNFCTSATKIPKLTKISKFFRALDEQWQENANEVKKGPLEAAKITKTIAKLTKISNFVGPWQKLKLWENANEVKGDPWRDSENYEKYGNWENNKISTFCRAIAEKWRGNANEVKKGPLEAAKITKTTIIEEITKISRFFRALTKSDEKMQMTSMKTVDEAAKITKTTITAKITKIWKFFRVIDERWQGNANGVQEGLWRNNKKCKNYPILSSGPLLMTTRWAFRRAR